MFDALIGELSKLPIYEKRCNTEDYIELVFYRTDLNKWETVLFANFGTPFKPTGGSVSKEASVLADAYGGIFPNQTMYKKDDGDICIIAMFWPWQDNEHITLKMAKLKRASGEETPASMNSEEALPHRPESVLEKLLRFLRKE